ncbi:MAG: DNA mismatch repair protein MutL [Verrucomicrobia subdivision 3 bacterium]|nr:DNA mismatch repair protein MutL [Limisphaerales bacterium]MCS1413424.1 DNA mismatch repair protein MutL [Limisphaerales bacterium]
MTEQKTVKMSFDPNTIEHLGVQMYSTLPPVIAELVANAYDADASSVKISLEDKGKKRIIIEDNGHGMSFEDLEAKFLKIGRNRREKNNNQYSESGERKVIGKKGIGKLSFFGIAGHVEIATCRDSKENIFEMDWGGIKQSDKEYHAPVTKHDASCTKEQSGTKVTLTDIRRKTPFEPDKLAVGLARKFSVFNEAGFKAEIIHNQEQFIKVTDKMKYEGIDSEYPCDFPYSEVDPQYEYAGQITGKIISAKTPVVSSMKGIALFSRGKLVNDHEFYGEKASSHGYAYLTGWLDVDFIDEWKQDVIGTNRQSLNWENEKTTELRNYLQKVVKKIYLERRKKTEEKKKADIKKKKGTDIDQWLEGLPKCERALADKIVKQIITSEGIDTEKAGELVSYVQDAFQFKAFKDFAKEIAETEVIESTKFVELLKEWQLVEAKELYRLSIGRISTIKELSKHIEENSKEVPTMHQFFKEFPWLLDPRIIEFKHEFSFSKFLKEKFPDKKLEEADRRIDFVCTSVSNSLFIIELKRPGHKITTKDLDQAARYRSFLQNYIGNTPESAGQIDAYVVGGKYAIDHFTKSEIDYRKKSGIFVKTYSELLRNAKTYHQEFIDKYKELQKIRQKL